MKNKGFTLVELLGVMVILSIIAIITFPIILNVIKKGNKKISDASMEIIKNSADLYLDDKNIDLLPGQSRIISLKDLKSEGLITDGLVSKDIMEYNNVEVIIESDGNKIYRMTDRVSGGSDDFVCTRSSSLTYEGVGRVDGDGFQEGTEYKCDPGDGRRRTFYVYYNFIYNSEATVSLISAVNIGGNVTHTQEAANLYLNQVTSGWTRVAVNHVGAQYGTVEPNTMLYTIMRLNTNCPVGSCSEPNMAHSGMPGIIGSYFVDSTNIGPTGKLGVARFQADGINFYYLTGEIEGLTLGVRPMITVDRKLVDTVAK